MGWSLADRLRGMPSTTSVLASCCSALAATPPRLVRPRRRDGRLLASITDAGVPSASTAVRLTALPQARQKVPAAVIAEGVRTGRRLAIGMTTFLVEHPRARFLIDPALGHDVHARVLPELPGPLRIVVTPDRPVLGLIEALDRAGHRPEDLDFAVPTHLHWDHVAGLTEIGSLAVLTTEIERAHALDGPDVPLGYVRGPLLDREIDTYTLSGPPVLTFAASLDLFGDGSVVLVDLSGHTPGSIGVLLAVEGGRRVLLTGDAIWHGLQARLLRQKAPFPGRLVDADREATFATVHRLHALPETIEILASHDRDAATPWTRLAV